MVHKSQVQPFFQGLFPPLFSFGWVVTTLTVKKRHNIESMKLCEL